MKTTFTKDHIEITKREAMRNLKLLNLINEVHGESYNMHSIGMQQISVSLNDTRPNINNDVFGYYTRTGMCGCLNKQAMKENL